MRVINQARIDFKYRLSQDEPVISKTIFTNKVSTIIITERLSAVKCVDKHCASIYDVLTYKIKIINISCIEVTNVYFRDLLPKTLKFIENSFKINGVVIEGKTPKELTRIGNIFPEETVLICFKSIIKSDILTCLYNRAKIYFDYLYDISKPPIRLEKFTNSVLTVVKNDLFKQFSVNSNINICYYNREIYEVAYIEATISIIEYKIIKSNMVKRCDEDIEDLYKLVVIGSIEYEIIYRYRESFNSSNSKNKLNYCKLPYKEGFVTSLLVPSGIINVDNINIDISIEEISTSVSDNHIYVNSDIFIIIK